MDLSHLRNNYGLLLFFLVTSAGGHVALALMDRDQTSQMQFDREAGMTSVSLNMVQAQPRPQPQETEPEPKEMEPSPVELPRQSAPVITAQRPIDLAHFAPPQADVSEPDLERVARERPTPTETVSDTPVPQRELNAVELPDSVEVPQTILSRESQGVDVQPRIVSWIEPAYPPDLRARGIRGSLQIWVRVNAAGRVMEARIHKSAGYEAFDQSALSAVRRSRFSPARRGSAPVDSTAIIPINFKFRSDR